MLRDWVRKLSEWHPGWEGAEDEPQRKAAAAAGPDEGLTPDNLQQFQVFCALSHAERLLFAQKLELRSLARGDYLFRAGDHGDEDYLLFSGKLQVCSDDGGAKVLVGGDDSARYMVSSLRPRKHNARALSDCRVIALDAELAANLLQPGVAFHAHPVSGAIGCIAGELDPLREPNSERSRRLMRDFQDDLDANRVKLTSLPSVAGKLQKVVNDAAVPTDALSQIIGSDPVIAPKIIRIANSALYQGYERCETVKQSVVRLGVNTTRQLVLSFAMRELFQASDPRLQVAMSEAWQETVAVAAIASVLSRHLGVFTPEDAMLAGILSNIGVLSIFNYLEQHPEIIEDGTEMEAILTDLRGPVGAMILESWGFSEALVECARHAGDWERTRTGDGDLCDLVITACLHASIGVRHVPRIDHVSACVRLLHDRLVPEFAVQLVHTARREIKEIENLLHA